MIWLYHMLRTWIKPFTGPWAGVTRPAGLQIQRNFKSLYKQKLNPQNYSLVKQTFTLRTKARKKKIPEINILNYLPFKTKTT